MRSLCLLTLAGLTALGAVPASDPPEPVPPPGVRWVEITPLVGDGPVRLLRYAPGEPAEEVTLKGGGRQLVCSGGETGERRWALRCQEHLVDDGDRVPLAWNEGVAVTGRVWVAKEPAPDSRVTVLPAGLETVRLRSLPLQWEEDRHELGRSVETAEDGQFHLPPLAPGGYILALRLPGGRLVHTDPVTVPDPAELRRKGRVTASPEDEPDPLLLDLGDLVFEGGAAIRVLVIDGEGLPVGQAKVAAGQGAGGERAFFETSADQDGVAVVSGLDPLEAVDLGCGRDGYRWLRVSYPSPPAEHLCRLQRLARVRGQVVDPEGEPVRATLRLTGRAAPDGEGRDDEPAEEVQRGPLGTDEAGQFTLDGLPAGDYLLAISAPGFSTAEVRATLEPGEERDLEPVPLQVGRRWEGHVVDRATGEPIPGARIHATDPPGVFEAVADDEGHFEAVTGIDRPLGVEAEAPGFPPTPFEIRPRQLAADEPVVLELDPGGFLEIHYWNPEGEPCGGCPVSVLGPSGSHQLATGLDGSVRSEALAPGRYQVTPVELRSFGGVVSRSGGSRNHFGNVRPGAVERVVLGEPRLEVDVEIWPAPPPGWRLRISGQQGGELHELDAGGRAVVRWPTGEVRVLLNDGAGGQVELTRIAEPPRDRRVVLDLPGGGVSGRLLQEEGGGLGGQHLSLMNIVDGRVRARGVVRDDGSFELRFILPGHYALAVGEQMVRTVAVGERLERVGEVEVGAAEVE